MDNSFWNRLQTLKESFNGGVDPLESVTLQTRIVKISLGMCLIQSLTVAMWWSIKDSVFYPWLFFISTFLQVGWVWNKVTESWKIAHGYRYVRVHDVESTAAVHESYYPPTININNNGVTGETPIRMSISQDSLIDMASDDSDE